MNGEPSVADMRHVTWDKDRRLWLELRYDEFNQPALTDMHIVSKGSRRLYTDRRELQQVLSGQVYNRWKSSMVGAVTVIQCKQDGRLVTAEEALKQGTEGEVLFVVR